MVERSDRFGIIPGFQARKKFLRAVLVGVILVGLIPGCSVPTLVEVARRRQGSEANGSSGQSVKDDVRVKYYVTDLDVLNFTDEVKRKLMNRANLHVGFAYGTSAAGLTLGSLSGAAKAIGWGVSTASGLGLGAAYMFAMGKLFDPGGKAQAYEQSFTAIQAAEANYYFRQLGMGFDPKTGRLILGDEAGRADIPSGEVLTPDGEILYYRVTKILKVLNDTLSSKIPDVQDLQDAQGQITSPRPTPTPPTGGKANGSPKSGGSETGGQTEGQKNIPSQLLARNLLLESAFKALTDDDAAKRLNQKGLTPQEGLKPKEYLAKVILAKCDLPLRPGDTAIQSLTFYRSHASTEAATANLEDAYRFFNLLPQTQE